MSKLASIRITDRLHLAYNAIKRNGLRSGLTMSAIAFGVAVMMYLITMGLGLEKMTLRAVENSAQLLTLNVTPPNTSENINPLTPEAIAKLQAIPNVAEVLPRLMVKGQMSLDKAITNVTIFAVDSGYIGTGKEVQLTVGQAFQNNDTQTIVVSRGFLKLFGLNDQKVPLVTFKLLFNQEAYPGASDINDLNIVGVIDDDATTVYMPRLYAESLIGQAKKYEEARVKVISAKDIESVTEKIIASAFKVQAVVETISEVKRVFGIIRWVLFALGLTAIFVASIGMFNTLTVSLLERTREIGIMKSLGVKRKDITRLFLTESFMMGLFGGVGGVVLTLGLQQLTYFVFSLLATLAKNGAFVPQMFENPWYIVLGFMLFSLIISFLTGVYPAQRAANINPLEAIRYE